MAARRLAISSLLCDDDPQPSTSASAARPSPPHSPSKQIESGSTPFQSTYQPRNLHYPDRYPRRGHSPPSVGRDSPLPVSQFQGLSLRPPQLPLFATPSNHQDHESPRKEYQPIPLDGIDHSNASSSGPFQSYTYPPLDYDRLRRQPSQPDLTQQQQPSFHPSDPYTYHYPSPVVDNSLSLARPLSSRSGYSGSPPTSFPFPHHSQSPHPSQSPSHSPTLPYSNQSHRASESPNLSVHRLSASPHHFYTPSYSPRHTQPSYTLPSVRNHSPPDQHTPSASYFPDMSPHHQSPLLPVHSPSHTRPTLAALLTTSPVVSRSAASLPNILNATSPISRTPASAFGPLEALVQAATQERRRLSGEMQRGVALEEGISTTAAQAPLVVETSELPEPRSYQPYYQPSTYQNRSEHVVTSPSVSASRLLNDGHPLPTDYSVHTDEPPAKRRRGSGESQVAISVTTILQDKPVVPSPQLSPLPTVPSEESPPKSLVMRSEDPVPIFASASAPVQEKSAETPVDSESVSRPESRQDPVEGKVEVNVESSGRDEKGKKEKKERKPAKTSGKPKGKDLSQVTTEPAKQEPSERVSQEQDPHQWLLEHYTSPPAPAPSHPPPVDQPMPMATDTYREPIQSETERETKGEGKPTSRGSKHKEKKSDMVVHRITPAPVPTTEIDIELELATASTPTHVEAKREDPTEMDVDDELLSLVDDKPHLPHVPLQQPPQTHSNGPSHSAHLKPSSVPKNGRLTGSRSPSVAPTGLKSERGSMPPPATSTPGPSREDVKGPSKLVESSTSASASGSKKKDTVAKPPPKPKAATKPKPKTTAKGKTKAGKDTSLAPPANAVLSAAVALTSVGKGKKGSPFPASGSKRGASATVNAPSRSRSTSVMPPPSEPEKVSQEESAGPKAENVVDDKLYCVCKTGYDEDRVMIACDRCDEWYHTQCVNMPDLEVDLVDQFICPVCVANNPTVSLNTTYKKRCLNGLKHPHPSSAQACHKPARGVFSKYCSDECGVMYMQARLKAWGGDKELLWESVKHAAKRESVIIRCLPTGSLPAQVNGGHGSLVLSSDPSQEIVQPTQTKAQREAQRLQALLDKIAARREETKKDMEVVLWREKLLELATERAANVEGCGWDQRLCFGDEDYAEFGPGVMESYEDEQGSKSGDAMQVDSVEESVWWCQGRKKCDRHSGWQKLRQAEVMFEKETMEGLLSKLTAEERELRKRLEDAISPPVSQAVPHPVFAPLQPLNGKVVANGVQTLKVNGEAGGKKGKKRKKETH